MNILKFKNATQAVMKTRAYWLYKKFNQHFGWLFILFSAAAVAGLLYSGAHIIPILPFEGKELTQAVTSWQLIVVAKFAITIVLSCLPVFFTNFVLEAYLKRIISKSGIAISLIGLTESASHEDKHKVIQSALKLENYSGHTDVEQLQQCVKEDLPKSWWRGVHNHIKIEVQKEASRNPHHPCRTPAQNRLSAARIQLENRSHKVLGSSVFKV